MTTKAASEQRSGREARVLAPPPPRAADPEAACAPRVLEFDAEVLGDADRLGRAISRFVRVVTRVRAGAPTDARGLDVSSMRLLSALSENGPQRANSLAEAVVSDPSTVSRQIAQLVKLGMVSRHSDEADRRAWVLAVTPAGAEALAQHYAQRESF